MMENTTVQEQQAPKGLTFEAVWDLIQETGRQIKAMNAETDRQIKAMNAETDRRIAARNAETERFIKELTEKTDRQFKETDRKIGKLGSRLGELVEHIMSPKLQKKFEKLGYRFNHLSRNHEIEDENRMPLAEIDVLLENGEYAMAVEVKTRLTTEDVKDHVKRMGILRRVADEHGDRRKYLGAVAGAVTDEEVQAYAVKNGFYLIIPSGETVDIEIPDGFEPRIW
jgi:predicted RecB family endonuclease